MGHKIRLIVPTRKEAELGPLIGRIIGRWGGVTISDAVGWWSDKNGKPIRDVLSVLECSIGNWDREAMEWWYDLSVTVCSIFKQDCVFLSVTIEDASLIKLGGTTHSIGE